MKTIAMTQDIAGWVRLDLGKGVLLKLRASDYYAGIAAGKAEQRGKIQAAREAQGQAAQKAQALGWIGTDAPDRP